MSKQVTGTAVLHLLLAHHVIGSARTDLKSEENLRERLHPDQVGGDDHGGGVVGAVVVRWGFTCTGVCVCLEEGGGK